MKKSLLLLATILGILSVSAQGIPEPEFIGEVLIVDLDKGQYRLLPKERASKRNMRVFNTTTTRLILSSKESDLKLGDNNNYSVIIKAANNEHDPRSLFQVIKLGVNNSNERYVEIGSSSATTYVASSEANTQAFVSFSAKKYGESSYILTFPITPGEYGIITDTHDDAYQIISTFSIFNYQSWMAERKEAERKALEEMKKLESALKKQAEREMKRANKKSK